jgi:hypothetical protein
MKFAGLLLLLAGWGIVLCAVALLRSALQRSGFVVVGLGIEILGLVLLLGSHRVLPEEERG